MKFNKIFQLSCLIIIGILSTAFIQPTPVVEVPNSKKTAHDFAEFLSHFKKVELPYSMNLEDFKQYESYKKGTQGRKSKKMRKKKINSQPAIYSEFLPKTARAMFSRKGGPSNYPVARFYPNEKMIAIVYCTRDVFAGNLFQSYNLAIYNLKGEILFPKSPVSNENLNGSNSNSQQRVAYRDQFPEAFNIGSTSHEKTISFRIDEKGNIWKNTYDNVWKKSLKKKGYRNNQLVDFKIKDTQVFQLNDKGVVEELKAIPSDGRASLN